MRNGHTRLPKLRESRSNSAVSRTRSQETAGKWPDNRLCPIVEPRPAACDGRTETCPHSQGRLISITLNTAPSCSFVYVERHEAAQALRYLSAPDIDWPDIVAKLVRQRSRTGALIVRRDFALKLGLAEVITGVILDIDNTDCTAAKVGADQHARGWPLLPADPDLRWDLRQSNRGLAGSGQTGDSVDGFG